MWLEKSNYLIHLISHQKSNIAGPCWLWHVEISELAGHAASNFDPPLPMAEKHDVTSHSTKDGLEVSCVSNDH